MKEELRLKVAEHVVGLKVKGQHHTSFAKDIIKAYETFLSEDKPAFFIDVELSCDAPPSDFPLARLTFKDNVMTIEDDCLSGSLDLTKRYGKIKLNPINPLYPLGTFLRNTYTFLVTLEDKGIVLHGAGILKGEEVYIFIGPSGAGKTTVTNLSSDSIILSDDLVMIKKVDGKFSVFPTPAWGDKQRGHRENRPYGINSIFKLIKDKSVHLERFSPARSLANMFTIPHIPTEFIPYDELMTSFLELVSAVPYYGLHFLPEPSFWTCIDGEKSKNPR